MHFMQPSARPAPMRSGPPSSVASLADDSSSTSSRAPSPSPSFFVVSGHDAVTTRSTPSSVLNPRAVEFRAEAAANVFAVPASQDFGEWARCVHATLKTHYAAKCGAEKLFMVAVFHLSSRTTDKMLLNIFFPTGASEARMVPPVELERLTGMVNPNPNGGVGVVFFTRRDFAVVAVEKVHNFVPNGQRHPLLVLFEDGEALPQAATCPAPKPLMVPVLPSYAPAAAESDITDEAILHRFANKNAHIVAVHNLSKATTDASLYKMFYPLGAFYTYLFEEPVKAEGRPRLSGAALFNTRDMAQEAAAKMNDFVPLGQRRPIIARYLEQAAPTGSAATPRGRSGGAAEDDALGPLQPLLAQNLEVCTAKPQLLAAAMRDYILANGPKQEAAVRMAAAIQSVLNRMGDSCVRVSSGLQEALDQVHRHLGITDVKNPQPVAVDPAVREMGTLYMTELGKSFLNLIAEPLAARQPRIVAAVQCAFLYDRYTYLPHNPVAFAVALLKKCEKELTAARAFQCKDSLLPATLEEEQRHWSWVVLVEALNAMVEVWRRTNREAYLSSSELHTYVEFERYFRTSGETRWGRRSDPCTPVTEAVDGSVEMRKSHVLTPSSRPTPRRVVTKVHNSDGTPPRVVLSTPFSDRVQGLSVDYSVESSGGPPAVEPRLSAADDTILPHNRNSTVYITRMPSHLSSRQVRAILASFGEVRKVRLSHDTKEVEVPLSGKRVPCFGFVEFAKTCSAQAMVDVFRNAAHTPNAFGALRATGVLSEKDVKALFATSVSRARSPIHDQQPHDATRLHGCLFGLVLPEVSIGDYAAALEQHPDLVKAVADTARPPALAFSYPAPFSTSAAPPSFCDPVEGREESAEVNVPFIVEDDEDNDFDQELMDRVKAFIDWNSSEQEPPVA